MSNDEETMQGLDGSAFAANLFVEIPYMQCLW